MAVDNSGLSRRDLFGRGSALTLGLMLGGASALHAEELTPTPTYFEADEDVKAPPVSIAVIGLGEQGRTLLKSLAYVPGANVAYVCDTYAPAHKRGLENHPKAQAITDYKQALGDKAVQAVYVATPSHLHKQIVVDALAAGKHVYCEMPMASSIEDARVIARAARAVEGKQVFHSGLQQRTNPQHNHVLKFIRIGALSKIAQAKSQWHKKDSWRRTAASNEREEMLNWRLKKANSSGLMGEIGIHQIDVTSWYLKARPVSVSGFGGTLAWNDGREVPDTVQCVMEYPEAVHLSYDATLANSFDGAYELFQGTDAAVVLRDGRAWMFKEPDAPALGWEVYAAKEKIGDETGIALVADATKLLAAGKEPAKNRDTDPTKGSLYHASIAFLNGIRASKPTACGWKEGWEATVAAVTAHEAVMGGKKIEFTKEMWELG